MKSFTGCWTCRLRRKKCDEVHPVCGVCGSLRITCYYGREKPGWMDGGVRQEEMAERMKREVKERFYERRFGDGSRNVDGGVGRGGGGGGGGGREEESGREGSGAYDVLNVSRRQVHENEVNVMAVGGCQQANGNTSNDCTVRRGQTFEWSDTVLFTFYLDHLFPFLFPFYRPSPLQGGKAWVLEMMTRRPVVRQTILCQSSYFFSLVQGAASRDTMWERMLTQTKDAFTTLRRALQVIYDADVADHLHGAVRIMASIMQLQRFEVAVGGFENCGAHLGAAVTLFEQLMSSVRGRDVAERFRAVMDRLGRQADILSTQGLQIPSAEQAAFRFSTALLTFDDIIASTIIQEQPRLYEYHSSLLGSADETEPLVSLEAVVGCQNWVLICVGEIAVLDAWKQQCKRAGNLDIMELVDRATAIKSLLETRLKALESNQGSISHKDRSLPDVFTEHSQALICSSSLVSRIWAHASLLYLSIVVSGWQIANISVRHHVDQVIELITDQASPPKPLRSILWPFFVAGCLAGPAQEAHFRKAVEILQPSVLFGTSHKALDMLEDVWRSRDSGEIITRDLAACFRSQGDLVLLV